MVYSLPLIFETSYNLLHCRTELSELLLDSQTQNHTQNDQHRSSEQLQDESEEDRSRDDKSPRDDVTMATFRHEGSPEASPGTNLVSEPSDGVEAQGEESLRLEESKELESDTLQVFYLFKFQNISLRFNFQNQLSKTCL